MPKKGCVPAISPPRILFPDTLRKEMSNYGNSTLYLCRPKYHRLDNIPDEDGNDAGRLPG
jgi:hypothetical protein